jgi:hypothetical protein
VASYVEVETGKRSDRPELAKALCAARKAKATLLIAKLDRLARNVAFIANLMDAGVEFLACDQPFASRLTLHILAAVAEDKARRISERTKSALQAAKARGRKLGSPIAAMTVPSLERGPPGLPTRRRPTRTPWPLSAKCRRPALPLWPQSRVHWRRGAQRHRRAVVNGSLSKSRGFWPAPAALRRRIGQIQQPRLGVRRRTHYSLPCEFGGMLWLFLLALTEQALLRSRAGATR